MGNMNTEEIKKLFDGILEPKLKWSINTLGLLQEVSIDNGKLKVKVDLVTTDESEIKNFEQEVKKVLVQVHTNNEEDIELIIGKAGVSVEGIDGIKHIIMVASGKGGVGKSTVSVNLALGLEQLGLKVGLLDADIYGPSIPIMLDCYEHPSVLQDENIKPIEVKNLKFISIGSLVERDKAIDWRGQLASATIYQFLKKTVWGKLDVLVIDMPPGTGDIHLTLASKVKPDGVVLVATPGEVVLGDVKRSLDLIQKEGIKVLGLVENMSYMVCEECGHHNHPFTKKQENELLDGIETLVKIPLSKDIADASNDGVPIILRDNESFEVQSYKELSDKVNKLLV
jgi:ATP-binding protein involved in chromosome partitioning